MIQDLTLRWIVTLLFVLSAAECGFAIATGHRRWPSVVSYSLHAVMAVAMAVMAWPGGAALPTVPPMVFFLLATGWFAVIAASAGAAGHRLVTGYHALMMLAMAWMYAVMNGRLLPGQSSVAADSAGSGGHHAGHMNMPGMDMPDMPMGDSAPAASGYPAWIATLNWVCAIGFAVAAVVWLYRYLVARQSRSGGDAVHQLGLLSQAMMAIGMAVMFGVML
ncbi:DUF5134 domain-containing protein [Mycobacterium sp. DL592]|uniref:DUF5134 domain-containing protein n=1 Tax=Mycobacterium sp. DL592 TaxID=2675524 RepID=UPI00141E6BB3|nr:DUF5134 domain-containing protein [Mycobacterium sp. DL592]